VLEKKWRARRSAAESERETAKRDRASSGGGGARDRAKENASANCE